MDTSETSARFEIPCRNLRCKEMFHHSAEDDAFASGLYWCGQTQEAVGPDGQPVDKKQCCEGRWCYLQ
jgi:hypothetical protein